MVTQPNTENENARVDEQKLVNVRSNAINNNPESQPTQAAPDPEESRYLAGDDFLEPQDG